LAIGSDSLVIDRDFRETDDLLGAQVLYQEDFHRASTHRINMRQSAGCVSTQRAVSIGHATVDARVAAELAANRAPNSTHCLQAGALRRSVKHHFIRSVSASSGR
jgi:hypothetical protein